MFVAFDNRYGGWSMNVTNSFFDRSLPMAGLTRRPCPDTVGTVRAAVCRPDVMRHLVALLA
jgi:hypothetical protein